MNRKLLVTIGAILATIAINFAFMLVTKKQQPFEARIKTMTAVVPQNAAEKPEAESLSIKPSRGTAAIEHATKAGKYLFIFFYNNNNEQTLAMKRVFVAAMDKLANKSMSVSIDINDPDESDVVNKFGVLTAPMPLALALAPNGAVTGGFPVTVNEKQLTEAFVSPGMVECLSALQGGKLVFLCIQNRNTAFNNDAMRGVRDFKDDPQFAQFTEIVMLDPSDAAESKLLKQLQIEPATKEAITVFLAPPGAAIAKIKGATNKTSLIATLQSASSSCGPSGCAPSGCGPTQ